MKILAQIHLKMGDAGNVVWSINASYGKGENLNQNEALLKYLKTHRSGITQFEAFTKLGICRLSERCRELKAAGKKIGSDWIKVASRYGAVRVKCYWIA